MNATTSLITAITRLFFLLMVFVSSSSSSFSDEMKVIDKNPSSVEFLKLYDDFISKNHLGKYYDQNKNPTNDPSSVLSSSFIKLSNEDIEKFKKLGVKIIPDIIQKMREGTNIENLNLSIVLQIISKIGFSPDTLTKPGISKPNLYMEWWVKNRGQARSDFDFVYQNWINESPLNKFKRKFTIDLVKDVGYDSQTGKNPMDRWMDMPEGPEKERLRPFQRTEYQKLLDLGVAALPFAVEKIKEGDADLIDAVNYWTDDALKKSAEEKGIPTEQMRDYCVKWWEENKENWLLPPIEEKEK